MIFPVGCEDFRELITEELDFVDKTLFIKEVIDDRGTKVAVITRPLFQCLNANPSAVWSLLLMSGYLKPLSTEYTSLGTECKLAIPNREVHDLYSQMIAQWLSNNVAREQRVRSERNPGKRELKKFDNINQLRVHNSKQKNKE